MVELGYEQTRGQLPSKHGRRVGPAQRVAERMMEPLEVRARIGLIIPSSNRLPEVHMQRYAPPGVQAHVPRLRITGASHGPLDALLPRGVEAPQALADARSDGIVVLATAVWR